MDAIPAKVLTSRWRTLLQNCPWRHPITEWMHRAQSVASVSYTHLFGNFAKNFFPLFVTGALFAKMMDSVGYTKSIARFVARRLGKGKAIMSLSLIHI